MFQLPSALVGGGDDMERAAAAYFHRIEHIGGGDDDDERPVDELVNNRGGGALVAAGGRSPPRERERERVHRGTKAVVLSRRVRSKVQVVRGGSVLCSAAATGSVAARAAAPRAARVRSMVFALAVLLGGERLQLRCAALHSDHSDQ